VFFVVDCIHVSTKLLVVLHQVLLGLLPVGSSLRFGSPPLLLVGPLFPVVSRLIPPLLPGRRRLVPLFGVLFPLDRALFVALFLRLLVSVALVSEVRTIPLLLLLSAAFVVFVVGGGVVNK
jgi:hypothetical protein